MVPGEPQSFSRDFLLTISLKATQLELHSEYEFSVAAETVVGPGPPRTGKVKIGPSEGAPPRPSQPVLRASDTSVTLQWQNGYDPKVEPISGYVIQVQHTLQRSWRNMFIS